MSFLSTFCQHAAFIASGRDPPGSISTLHNERTAQQSFLRLIGCAYFKQRTSAFRSATPEALFQKGQTADDQHREWLSSIRNTARQRADTDIKAMPSTEALLLHWKRRKWVLNMWKCATRNKIELPGITIHCDLMHIIQCVSKHVHNLCCALCYSTDREWMEKGRWKVRGSLGGTSQH